MATSPSEWDAVRFWSWDYEPPRYCADCDRIEPECVCGPPLEAPARAPFPSRALVELALEKQAASLSNDNAATSGTRAETVPPRVPRYDHGTGCQCSTCPWDDEANGTRRAS
jgi:hypothetical protein